MRLAPPRWSSVLRRSTANGVALPWVLDRGMTVAGRASSGELAVAHRSLPSHFVVYYVLTLDAPTIRSLGTSLHWFAGGCSLEVNLDSDNEVLVKLQRSKQREVLSGTSTSACIGEAGLSVG